MAMTVNMHGDMHTFKAEKGETCQWLRISNDEGDTFCVFMPEEIAEAVAKEFNNALARYQAANGVNKDDGESHAEG